MAERWYVGDRPEHLRGFAEASASPQPLADAVGQGGPEGAWLELTLWSCGLPTVAEVRRLALAGCARANVSVLHTTRVAGPVDELCQVMRDADLHLHRVATPRRHPASARSYLHLAFRRERQDHVVELGMLLRLAEVTRSLRAAGRGGPRFATEDPALLAAADRLDHSVAVHPGWVDDPGLLRRLAPRVVGVTDGSSPAVQAAADAGAHIAAVSPSRGRALVADAVLTPERVAAWWPTGRIASSVAHDPHSLLAASVAGDALPPEAAGAAEAAVGEAFAAAVASEAGSAEARAVEQWAVLLESRWPSAAWDDLASEARHRLSPSRIILPEDGQVLARPAGGFPSVLAWVASPEHTTTATGTTPGQARQLDLLQRVLFAGGQDVVIAGDPLRPAAWVVRGDAVDALVGVRQSLPLASSSVPRALIEAGAAVAHAPRLPWEAG